MDGSGHVERHAVVTTYRRRRTIQVDLATHEKAYVTVRALANWADCDPRTIIRMIATHALVAVRVGREWRIPTDDARRVFRVVHTSRRIEIH